jgi:hypothetical protein
MTPLALAAAQPLDNPSPVTHHAVMDYAHLLTDADKKDLADADALRLEGRQIRRRVMDRLRQRAWRMNRAKP